MFNMTVRELYDLLKIEGCQTEIRFDYPKAGQVTLVWLNRDNKKFARAFSAFEVETIRIPEGMLIYARRQAEESFKQ